MSICRKEATKVVPSCSLATFSALFLVRSGPIDRQAGDRALPPKMQQDILQDVLTMAQKRGEAGLTAKHLESYAFDGKKNIFTPVKMAFQNHTFTMNMPARNGGAGRRMFQVSAMPMRN